MKGSQTQHEDRACTMFRLSHTNDTEDLDQALPHSMMIGNIHFHPMVGPMDLESLSRESGKSTTSPLAQCVGDHRATVIMRHVVEKGHPIP